MGDPADLLVISDCVLDIYYVVDRLPIGSGDISIAREVAVSPGGACNVAIIARKFGLRVSIVDRVGNDLFGDVLIKELEEAGVDTKLLKRINGPTTISNNIVGGEGHAFLGYVGVNVDLSIDDLDVQVFNGVDAVYISGFNASISRKAAKELLRIVSLIRNYPVKLFLDVGPARDNLDIVMVMVRQADAIFMNREEAGRLFGDSLPSTINSLASLGINAVIKLGDNGAILIHKGETKHCKPYTPSRIITTVGAGDTFNAAYIAGTIKGLDPEEACDLGNKVASMRLNYLTPKDLPDLRHMVDY
jgi:Sugar kinases, ribokinase family